MNRFLEQRDDAPPFDFSNSTAYGKLDDIEAIPESPGYAMLSFNLIDKNWLHDNGLQRKLRYRANDPLNTFDTNPYEQALIYRIEIKTRVLPQLYPALEDYLLAHQEKWFNFYVNPPTSNRSNSLLYTNLFTRPIPSQVYYNEVSSKHEQKLNKEFSLDTADPITIAELEALIAARTPGPQYLAAFDVGQGNSNGLISQGNSACPDIYFDMGAGVTGNRHTKPSPLEFCFSNDPLIIMSHWDKDHWAGACPKENGTSKALEMTWIVVNQKIDAVHKTFAMDIIAKKGKIRVLNMPANKVGVANLQNKTSIHFMVGSGTTRNASGIVLSVENNDPDYPVSWLLTGDCDYKYFLSTLAPSPPMAVIAPHHGADPKPNSVGPAPAHSDYRRLVYSFGGNNRFKSVTHPTTDSVKQHQMSGWNVGTWSTTPGGCVQSADIRSTADHAITGSKRGGILIGWEAVSLPLPNCRGCGCSTTLNNY